MREDDPRFLTSLDHVIRGVRRPLNVPNPAAGAEFSVTPPGGRLWRVLGGQATLATSIQAANRLAGAKIVLSGAAAWLNGNTTAIPASQNGMVAFAPVAAYNPNTQAGGFSVVPIYPFWLAPGDTFASLTGGLQTNDQYSAITLAIEEAFFDMEGLSLHRLEREQALRELLGPEIPTSIG